MNEHATMMTMAAGKASTVASVAGVLPRLVLRGNQIETWNALVSIEGTELKVAGLTVSFRRQPASPARRYRHTLRWIDTGVTRTALVSLQAFPFSETHGADLRAETLDELPSHLGVALETSALSLVAERLSRSGLRAQAVEVGAEMPSGDSIDVVLRIGGLFSGDVALRLCGTPGALASLAGIDGVLALARVSPVAETVRVPLAVRLDDKLLTAAEVADLEIGDAILLDGTPRSSLVLSALRRRLVVERMQDGWMITEIGMEGDHGPSGANEENVSAGGRSGEVAMPDPSRMPVVVAFEIATMEVPIGQLATWAPGALVDFGLADVSAGLPVTVRIGGRQLARGDLVRIDDRFAVRLSAVAPWSNTKGNGA